MQFANNRRLSSRSRCLFVLCGLASAMGQTGSDSKSLPAGLTATPRFAATIGATTAGKPNPPLQAALNYWSFGGKGAINVPPQGFYIAELQNGEVMTVIDGDEKIRYSGELWIVKEGQSMIIRALDSRQQSVSLNIFSVQILR
jgi:hypothetical protein